MATLEQQVAEIGEGFALVQKNAVTQDDAGRMRLLSEQLADYKIVRDQVVSLAASSAEDAMQLFRSEAAPRAAQIAETMNELFSEKSLAGNQISSQLSSQSQLFKTVMLCVLLIAFAFSILLALLTTKDIVRPLKEITAAAKSMAKGSLKSVVLYQSGNEFGQLADSMRTMIERIAYYMDAITLATKQLAAGDLNVRKREAFDGDFLPVQLAIRELVQSFNTVFGKISVSADQVASGAEQVSNGAQSLSQGATQQASSVQELADTINEISNRINSSAGDAAEATLRTKAIEDEADKSNRRMKDLLEAMQNISQSSEDIEKIIKTIEDIAFQTNILALNAAVEAARAGEAGKGFAVVADEVRSLASKSAQASQSTAELIASSLVSVQNGTRIADETAQVLNQVVGGVREISQAIQNISDTTNEESQAVSQVTQGIDQISSVVQTNSATAEESAAASEELFGQSQLLKTLVGQFKLNQASIIAG